MYNKGMIVELIDGTIANIVDIKNEPISHNIVYLIDKPFGTKYDEESGYKRQYYGEGTWFVYPSEIKGVYMEKQEFNYDKVKKAVEDLLIAVGEDPNRPGLKETPRRVAGYWQELLEGTQYTNREIAEKFNKEFEVGYDPIVTMKIDNLFSHCEHHLALMFNGSVIIGYVPLETDDGKGYKVLGLSKIPRIVDMCCKRLQLQEKIASDIAECISIATGSKQIYVNLTMDHGCVSARGIKANSSTNVTFMTTDLRRNKDAREEFERKALELNSKK